MNDTSMNDASRASGISLEHANFPHLSTFEWEALHRLVVVAGEGVIKTLLTAGTEEQQRLAAQEFMVRELADLRLRVSTPTSTKNKTDIVKIDVSTYSGEGDKRLHLNRWFCEVDIAIEARQISTELARTRFLLSKLGGKAKELALGKLVADASCFPTMDSMKVDLRLAFEPPQDESIQRSDFLALKQGRMPMLEYIQHARHLVSCLTTNPMDMVTQIHVFISGMNAGYQRFYLTRKTPSTLEEAFAIAPREDYSVTASQAFDVSRPITHGPEPEPMEVDAIQNYGGRREPTLRCFRCQKPGHRAAVCRALTPVVTNVSVANDVAVAYPTKNGDNQTTSSPYVLRAQLSATTSGSDSRLIVLSLHVDGASRPIRALLDSGATNNFVGAESL
ncbi:Polyprotein [Phytophthora palmivora]|uniref:Polyprotein n=1 Tax=Phytophthora palmivora TaxID=4796 RepID=A0A2P4XMM4_9STRA|nr:Polyprotein [Phytophthora palmivora]